MNAIKKLLNTQVVLAPSTWSRILMVMGAVCWVGAAVGVVGFVVSLAEMSLMGLVVAALSAFVTLIFGGLATFYASERRALIAGQSPNPNA